MTALARITVEVSQEAAEALRRAVRDGAYLTEGEMVEEALRDWASAHGQGDDVTRLRRLIAEADASGPPVPAEQAFAAFDEFVATYDRRA